MQRHLVFALVVLLVCLPLGRSAWADIHDCKSKPGASDYAIQRGDVEDARHISLTRELLGVHKLQLSSCTGKLQIERSPDDRIHLRIESQTNFAHPMHEYIEHLNLSDGTATITLDFPKAKVVNVDSPKEEVVITLQLPPDIEQSEINLGAGNIWIGDGALKGDRKVNLGAGDVHLILDGDHDYSSFEANVGMGSFHDHRPGGASSHFIISRNYEGKGEGSLEVNVGAGSIEIDPGKGETI